MAGSGMPHRDRENNEESSIERPPSWEGVRHEFFHTVKVAIVVGIIASLVLYFFVVPKFLLPLVGKCRPNEGILDCHFRNQAEEEKLRRFEDCQRSCGRAAGSNLCLEQCEYDYGMGKWQYAQTYKTATGNQFRCPQGEQGYEDTRGRGYCQ